MRRLFIFSVSLSAAVFVAQYAVPPGWLLPASGGFLVLGLLALMLKGDKKIIAMLAMSGACAGFLWNYGYDLIFISPARALDGMTAEIKAEVSGYPHKTDYGYRVQVRLSIGKRDFSAALYTDEAGFELKPGDTVETAANLSYAGRLGGTDVDYFTSRGIFLIAYQRGEMAASHSDSMGLKYIPAKAANYMSEMIGEIFSSRVSPFMSALLFGDRSGLDDSFSDALSLTGMSHIVSVSGLHIVFLVGFITTFIKRKKRASLIAIPTMLFFMAMVGNTPSVVRAGIMQIFILVAPFFDRESDGATSLGAALMLLLLYNPCSASHAGLQLSFAATAGIMAFSGRINDYFAEQRENKNKQMGKIMSGAARFFSSAVATTLGAMVISTPLVAMHYGYVSIVSPITNAISIWAVSLAFSGGLAACLLRVVFAPLGAAAACIASLPAIYVMSVAELFARVPFAAVYTQNAYVRLFLIYAYAVILVFIFDRTQRKRIIFPLCLCAVSFGLTMLMTSLHTASGLMNVTALDMGQGQSIVITADEATVLIDCGGNVYGGPGAYTTKYIKSIGRARIDAIVLTHFHDDHAGGIETVLKNLEVTALLVPLIEDDEDFLSEGIIATAKERGTEVIYVTENMVIEFDKVWIELFAPIGSKGENERGLTILGGCEEFEFLITGDMGAAVEKRLLMRYNLPDIEVLVSGHHGSKYSTSTELLSSVTPEVAIISVGKNNYGHPAVETVARIEDAGAAIFRTDSSGNITVRVR